MVSKSESPGSALPEKKNEISGLLIMGICGGAVFPMIMGAASDAVGGQAGALAILSLGILYLLAFYLKGRKAPQESL